MYTANAARNRYSANNLDGVPGPRIVVMCFDRLERDLNAAIAAIEARDHYEANSQLGHAQDLIGELATMLDAGAWEHAGSLLALYDYLLRLLAVANMKKDPARVAEALRHVSELGNAFRAAERDMSANTAAPVEAVAGGEPVARPRVSVQA